jgi:predicted metalloprotease with PDZ domain
MSPMSDNDQASGDAAVTYHIRPLAAGTRLLEVSCRVRAPDPQGQVFALPAWIPGSYLIRDFARHVVTIEASAGGSPVGLRKLDKSTWSAAPCDGEIVVRMQVYSGDLSVRGAHLDASGAFFNGSSVFLRVQGREAERCIVHVSPGDDPVSPEWRVATALTRLTGSAWEYGAFEAAGYEELIDHPVMAGALTIAEFDAAGTPHAVVLAGRHSADLERLTGDLARLCTWQIDLFGRPAPMSRYLFLVRLTGEGFGGLEHRASTALVCHRNDLPHKGGPQPGKEYRNFLGLASHEYFHAWNVKRIRPAAFTPYDLARESYTRQLWIFEGITSYYDDLCLVRSGLMSREAYLELLGRNLTSVYRVPGRRRQTLEEASFDSWIKFYRPDENSPNAQVSYYTKGAMVALALDLEVRIRTQGLVSLDDIMRTLWKTHGKAPGTGLPEGAFEELAGEVAGIDLSEFFRRCVRDTVDPPVGILLAQFGIRLTLRAAEGAADAGGSPGQRGRRLLPWTGGRARAVNGWARVAYVAVGGPAEAAGLAADDEIVAIDGLRVDADAFEAACARLTIGRATAFHVFRRDELLSLAVVPAEPPRDTCHLSFDEEADEKAVARQRQWLPTPG